MMKEVNNFEAIIPYLKFKENLKSIILVWVVKRNKDGNTEAKGNNKNRTIKSYHFQSLEHFIEKETEIIELCKEFNCRAYICMNPKPILNVLFTLQGIVMEHIKEVIHHDTKISLKGMIDSAVMKSGGNGDEKLWVVDIDDYDSEKTQEIVKTINESCSGFALNVIAKFPTVHGCHLITHPFDIRDLAAKYPEVEVKKEGLTLLYAYVKD